MPDRPYMIPASMSILRFGQRSTNFTNLHQDIMRLKEGVLLLQQVRYCVSKIFPHTLACQSTYWTNMASGLLLAMGCVFLALAL